MKQTQFKGALHSAFTVEEAREKGLKWVDNANWREAQEGQWVECDDGYIVEVQKSAYAAKMGYRWIRTAWGTYLGSPGSSLDTVHRESPWTFSGKKVNSADAKDPNRKLTRMERVFSKAFAETFDVGEAYKIASGNMDIDDTLATRRGARHMKKPAVQNAVETEIQRMLTDAGLSKKDLIDFGRDMLEDEKAPASVRKGVWDRFLEMQGMLDKGTKVEAKTVVALQRNVVENVVKGLKAGDKVEEPSEAEFEDGPDGSIDSTDCDPAVSGRRTGTDRSGDPDGSGSGAIRETDVSGHLQRGDSEGPPEDVRPPTGSEE